MSTVASLPFFPFTVPAGASGCSQVGEYVFQRIHGPPPTSEERAEVEALVPGRKILKRKKHGEIGRSQPQIKVKPTARKASGRRRLAFLQSHLQHKPPTSKWLKAEVGRCKTQKMR